jgi:hypothetical protein
MAAEENAWSAEHKIKSIAVIANATGRIVIMSLLSRFTSGAALLSFLFGCYDIPMASVVSRKAGLQKL